MSKISLVFFDHKFLCVENDREGIKRLYYVYNLSDGRKTGYCKPIILGKQFH